MNTRRHKSNLPAWLTTAALAGAGLLVVGGTLLVDPDLGSSVLGPTLLLVIGLWCWDRWTTRQRLLRLATQVRAGKLEVSDDPAVAALHQALNAALQQQWRGSPPAMVSDPQMVTTLAVSLGNGAGHLADLQTPVDRLAHSLHRLAQRTQAQVQPQGNGVFVLVFGFDQPRSLAQTTRAALAVVQRLHRHYPDLRFGLSCGLGLGWQSALGSLLISPALDDAVRLVRMTQSWSEYTLLCPEPVALLLSQQPVHRTPLELTSPSMAPLRIYALDLEIATPAAA